MLGADEPVDPGGRKCAAERRRDRDGVDDVAQRAETDEKEPGQLSRWSLVVGHCLSVATIFFTRSREAWRLGSPTIAVRPPYACTTARSGTVSIGVVGAFAVDVGLDPAQQPFDGVVGEGHDVIDGAEGRDDFGALARGHGRPPRPFQPCDGCVLVHRDNQAIGFGGRALQVSHVADVQQIEAAIGKRNRAPRGAIVRDGVHQLGLAQHPSHSLPCP